jgi:hypothetical protein
MFEKKIPAWKSKSEFPGVSSLFKVVLNTNRIQPPDFRATGIAAAVTDIENHVKIVEVERVEVDAMQKR